ncbi:MAG: hypothetical protein IJO79_01990 [Firmicutes bacterium]|nr:hypothetical protein [Bacillota bacterium]
MFDTLQIIFWSITYILVIVAGTQSWNLRKVSMPYVAGVLNFAWEICALYTSGGFWGHILWLGLDLVIVFFGFQFVSTKKQKTLYLAAIAIATISLFIIFRHPEGMLVSVFVIDLIMAIYFLIDRKKLSPKLKVLIAVTKLLGDLFAGLYYGPLSDFIAVTATIVLLCNGYYLYLCIMECYNVKKQTKEVSHYDKGNHQSRHLRTDRKSNRPGRR